MLVEVPTKAAPRKPRPSEGRKTEKVKTEKQAACKRNNKQSKQDTHHSKKLPPNKDRNTNN